MFLPQPPSLLLSLVQSVEVAVAIDGPGSGGLGAGAVVGLVLGLIIVLLLAAITASLLLLFLHRRRKRKLNLKETNDLHLSNPNYGKQSTIPSFGSCLLSLAATMDAAKYTKNTENVEVYASPYDTQTENQYAVPDVAQHYEAVSETNCCHILISFLHSRWSQRGPVNSGEYTFLLRYAITIHFLIHESCYE